MDGFIYRTHCIFTQIGDLQKIVPFLMSFVRCQQDNQSNFLTMKKPQLQRFAFSSEGKERSYLIGNGVSIDCNVTFEFGLINLGIRFVDDCKGK